MNSKVSKKKFKRIEIVTGCVRSGTQFLTQVLAEKYDCPYLREQRFDVRDWKKFVDLLENCEHEELIVHAPCLRHKVPEIMELFPNAKIYWMTRNFGECVESIKKMSWTEHNCQVEMIQYIDILPFSKHLFPDDYWALVVSCYFLGEKLFDAGLVKGGIVDMEALVNHPKFIKRTVLK